MSDRRSLKNWLPKRLLKKKEPNNLASHNAANVSAESAVSTSAVSVTEQSTIGPSTVIQAPSETTSRIGTNNIKTAGAVGVTVTETAAAAVPNISESQPADIIETESTPASLWDKAYDSLKQEQPELLSEYEDLLSRVLIKAQANSLSAPDQEEGSSNVRNQIPQHDVAARREKLEQIAELGLKHMEDKQAKVKILGHEIRLQEGVGKVGEAVDWAQTYIKDAIKDVPYAPAVMAGISLILPLLKNPAAVEAANRGGFTYVTSQIRYYVEMESLLLPADMKPGLKADLTQRVIDLYKLILEFQAQSVIWLYRSRAKNYFRSVINYDSWNHKLDGIKEEETNLEKKFEKALSSTSLQQLKKLAREAEGSRKGLNDIFGDTQKLVSIAERTEQHLSDAEDRKCRETLQATDPTLDKARIEDEKGGLLRDSYCWVLENVDFQTWRDARCDQLLWIKGDPGKGKTMLLCGIIDELSKMDMRDTNISFFFCQATNSRINNATAVLRGLIYMLVQQQPFLVTHVRDSSFEGENAWFALQRAFTKILGDPHLRSTYLIIDALDECVADLSRLLQLLVQKSSACSHVKWIVSSRNWPSIEKDLSDTTQIKLSLELNEDTLSAAVDSFIQYKVKKLAGKNKYGLELQDAVQNHLVLNSNGTFLWVALVCKELTHVSKRNVRKKLENFPSGLDQLYKRMFNQISESDDAELCKSLLSVITTVYRPITLDELVSCMDLPEDVTDDYESLEEVIGQCGSFLTLRGCTISLIHQSAKDFLRETFDGIFPGEVEDVHYSIFSKSMQVISRTLRTLRRDIYRLVAPGYSIDKVDQQDPDPLAAIGYACVYWVDHLNECSPSKNTNEDLQECGSVGIFFRQVYLHWLEALSLLKSLPEGVAAMLKLEDLLNATTKDSQLVDRVRDACRFVLYFQTAIENYPLQIYASGLIFSPAGSITRTQFQKHEPDWVTKPSMEESWSACLQTLEGHSGAVESVAFSHDSKLLASASSWDVTINIWDASNGACLQKLESHNGPVASVIFSHDSKLLASAAASWDDHTKNTIKIWDASNWKCLQTLDCQASVISITFSHDTKLLVASALADHTIKVWDARDQQCLQILEGHDDSVISVIFSHDSKLLASASCDKTIRIWDTSNKKCLHILKGHNDVIGTPVTFSHDSKLLASASQDKTTIRIWDTSKGEHIQMLESQNVLLTSVIFSHDFKLLASVSFNNTIKIWDTTAGNGQCLQVLDGHSRVVSSITFSHDSKLLASASYDKTIKIWDATVKRQWLHTIERHDDLVSSVVFSHDFKLLASASKDRTIRIWDASNGRCLHILKGHNNLVDSIVFSHDSKILASASWNSIIKIWNTSDGQFLQTFEGHEDLIASIIFSHDSKLLASASFDKTIKIWDANTSSGQCLQTLEGHDKSVLSIIFSHDSKLLASASWDHTIKIWDITAGNWQCLKTLEDHNSPVSSVMFSHDSKLLASASKDHFIKIWDANNWQCLQTLHVEFGTNISVKSFDITNSYLQIDNGTTDHLSLVLDTLPFEDNPEVILRPGYGMSSDRTWITRDWEKLLWIPPEYRPQSFAVAPSAICIGCGSGRVLLFCFDSSKVLGALAGD